MCKKNLIVCLTALLLWAATSAQSVLYSPFFRDVSSGFQVAGKAGDYYWIEKESVVSASRFDNMEMRQSFEVHDSRLNSVGIFTVSPPPYAVRKQFLVADASGFAQVLLAADKGQTKILIRKFSANGASTYPIVCVDSLPFTDDGSGFLLVRSPDHHKIQLIAFETTAQASPRMHVIFFNDKWTVLQKTVFSDPNITQPCIQDDFVSFPIEEFDNLPVKLANDGEWLMSASSRTGPGYLLFHFCRDGNYSTRHLRLPSGWQTQDLALTLDEHDTGVSVGILSSYRSTTLRQLQVTHYSRATGGFDFDSSYYFNTLAGSLQNKNLVNENLVGFPGRGYMLFKEYGRNNNQIAADGSQDPGLPDGSVSSVIGSPAQSVALKGGFARKSGLFALSSEYDRGDLSMFYFPGIATDSTWSGMLRSPQTTEMNWPALSYLVLPSEGKMMFVYNSPLGNSQYATTTVLDRTGRPSEGPMTFWRFSRILNFQRAHRISRDEVAVPYTDRGGFAVIRIPR